MISRKNIFNLKKKKEIYEFITENPGVYLREISRRLNIPRTTLIHHLKYLKKHDLIFLKFSGGYTRCWPTNKMGIKEKEMLGVLRQEIPRNILIIIYFKTGQSQDEISKELCKHPSTINFHLKKLKELDLIDEAPVENGKLHRLRKGYELIVNPKKMRFFIE